MLGLETVTRNRSVSDSEYIYKLARDYNVNVSEVISYWSEFNEEDPQVKYQLIDEVYRSLKK